MHDDGDEEDLEEHEMRAFFEGSKVNYNLKNVYNCNPILERMCVFVRIFMFLL